MIKYYLENDKYVIENYDKTPTFSSFLPGLAGIKGIPLWVFYTNRGQGINSFGIDDKSNAIMEFNPANTAYENTSLKGFRTFIKINGHVYQPFAFVDKNVKRSLYIKKNSFEIEEINIELGIKVNIKYYVLPNENIGGLVRNVIIENLNNDDKQIELIDGIPKIIPYGMKTAEYKELSNLLKSWTDVLNIENNIPYYTMKASNDDSSEVKKIEGGYYYLSVHQGEIRPVIYDTDIVFGYDNSLISPVNFVESTLEEMLSREQIFYNKIPCGFTYKTIILKANDKYEFNSMTGFSSTPQLINNKINELTKIDYFIKKENEADVLVDAFTKDIKTITSKSVFDQYIEQCYLDNFLRGGYPYVFNKDDNKSVVHLFTRKHGDPERDYNFFSIAGEYYSQGNGNFRDVNQNRRNDIFFNKDIGDFNIKNFFQLVQIDGYNPLEIRPSTFSIKDDYIDKAFELIDNNILDKKDEIKKIINRNFTPGQISNEIASQNISINNEDEFIEDILRISNQNFEAGYGEGYWSDHWNYNLDLIESFLKIYPDKIEDLLFEDKIYKFYDSPVIILDRNEKYVINKNNEIRQYGSLITDEEKIKKDGFERHGTNWLKNADGKFATTSLIGKLIVLALNKFALLDSHGMGIEMDGGKPGWNDAMNGIPGLFGSGMSETFELKRLIDFILKNLKGQEAISLPIEIYDFLMGVYKYLNDKNDGLLNAFNYWDKVSSLREEFRKRVRFNLNGVSIDITQEKLFDIFLAFGIEIDKGIKKASEYGNGIIPTYFTFKATEFEPILDKEGNSIISHYGLATAKVKAFEVIPLPSFLEGPTKMLATIKDNESAVEFHKRIKSSELYDKKLKMYKTSVPIDDISMENGRIRAFTPGWLERESIFLHMEYKYLLSMLKAGLFEEFYSEMQDTMVVFRDPKEYGRSILENSSFIASSRNPDKNVHGRGYVSRLSGSTTEALSIWIEMFIGDKVFSYDDNELKLQFKPNLPGWFFDENNKVEFTFLSTCKVSYINKSKKNTYGKDAAKIKKIIIDGKTIIDQEVISGKMAQRVRNGLIKDITIELE